MSDPEKRPQPAKRRYDPIHRRWLIVNFRNHQVVGGIRGDERGAESAAIALYLQTERRQTFYYKPME